MNSLTGPTAALSIILAVILWGLATWLEGAKNGPKTPAVEAVQAFADEVTADSRLRSDGVLQSCREAENTIRRFVDASQNCEVDDDCTIFDYGYPIQCLTSIAKSEITTLRHEYDKYQQSCEYRVYYDCPSEPLQRKAVCRSSHCIVELQTVELLRDATLNHIGVE